MGHTAVYRRGNYSLSVEQAGNFRKPCPRLRQPKEPLYDGSRHRVRNQMVLVSRVLLVAVGSKISDVAAPLHFGRKGRANFPGGIPGVHLVNDIFEGGYIRIGAVRIVPIIDGNIANSL